MIKKYIAGVLRSILLILGMAAGVLCGLAAELIFDRLKKAGL